MFSLSAEFDKTLVMSNPKPKAFILKDYRESLEYQLWLEEYGEEYAENMLRHYKKQQEIGKVARAKQKGKKLDPKQEEKKLQSAVLQALRTSGRVRRAWHNPESALTMGIPDVSAVTVSGKMLHLELKDPNAKWPPPKRIEEGRAKGAWLHYTTQKSWLEDLRGPYSIAEFCSSVARAMELLDRLEPDRVPA